MSPAVFAGSGDINHMLVRLTKARACAIFILVHSHMNIVFAEDSRQRENQQNLEMEKAGANQALALQYSSVFDGYVPFEEIPDIGWKEANDNVGEIGGWRAYAKLVQEEAKKKAALKEQADGGENK